MMQAIRSEFRKLLTIRSTFLLTGFVLLVVAFVSFYAFGYKEVLLKPDSPNFLRDIISAMIGIYVTFVAILSILMVAHEYRYNTISYTLTYARSRLSVVLAKVIVMLVYATLGAALVIAVASLSAHLGVALNGKSISPQTLTASFLGYQLAYIWGYALVGLILATLIRSVVGAIVAFFVIPVLEQSLTLLLKENAKYLPFHSLDAIGNTIVIPGMNVLSHGNALMVFSSYLLVSGTMAYLLFIKRDAN